MLLFVFRIMFVLWSGASNKLIMHTLPAKKEMYAILNGRGCKEMVFEHLEQLASPTDLDSDSQETVFYRVETRYSTVVSDRWDNITAL